MRLLRCDRHGKFMFTKDLTDSIPPYAILSHTWLADEQEVTFRDIIDGTGKQKTGYQKIRFCAERARRDEVDYIWVDTCCIDKSNSVELSEAITSMFKWYKESHKCYVYLSDVSDHQKPTQCHTTPTWESQFRGSRWFRRGWTLQELLAPQRVDFYTAGQEFLGDRSSLAPLIHDITDIPIKALCGTSLDEFPTGERMRWAATRQTKKEEDRAYSLQGIFGVFIPVLYGEAGHAFLRLQEAISRRHGSVTDTVHKHWLVPRQPHPLFTGRKSLLHDLERAIRTSVFTPHANTSEKIVISGLGGQGKSEIALQVATRLRYIFWAVVWIDVSNTELAERSFLETTQSLSVAAQTWQEALLSLSNLKRPWLLILDNADDLTVDYSVYFPVSPLGIIILTTRNSECHQYATLRAIHLEALHLDDACDLLAKACSVASNQSEPKRDQVRYVADLLQSHPLAILQAGAYIARGHCTVMTYPEVYQQQRRTLLAYRPRQAQSRYGDMYASLEVSAHALHDMQTQAARDASELLHLLVMYDPNRIPVSLLIEVAWRESKYILKKSKYSDPGQIRNLSSWHVEQLPQLIDPKSSSHGYRLQEALYLLKSLSLVSTRNNNDNGETQASLHPLLHAWGRDRQSDSEQRRSWMKAACLVSVTVADLSLPQEKELQTHVEALVSWDPSTIFVRELPDRIARVMYQCGCLLVDVGARVKVQDLMDTTFEHLRLNQQELNQSYLDLYALTASNLRYLRKLEGCFGILQQIVKFRRQTLPVDHRDRLHSERELAWAYTADGQIEEALHLLGAVVQVQQKSSPPTDRSRLESEYSLAVTYGINGRLSEAISMLEKVVDIQKENSPETDQSRLLAEMELAELYRRNDQLMDAIKMLERVERINTNSFGDDYAGTLIARHALALAYKDDDQLDRAIMLLEDVVDGQRQLYPRDHPKLLTVQSNLGAFYILNEQIDEARPLLEHVVHIMEKFLAEDDDRLLGAQKNLSIVYQSKNEIHKAVPLLENVVRVSEKLLAENSADLLYAKHNLAVIYETLDQVDRARPLIEAVVTMGKQSLAEHHPIQLEATLDLANCLWKSGARARALIVLRDVVRLCKIHLPPDHDVRRKSLQSLYFFRSWMTMETGIPRPKQADGWDGRVYLSLTARKERDGNNVWKIAMR